MEPTPVFWPGKSHGQRSWVGFSPMDHKRVGHNLATKQKQQSSLGLTCRSCLTMFWAMTPMTPLFQSIWDDTWVNLVYLMLQGPPFGPSLCHSRGGKEMSLGQADKYHFLGKETSRQERRGSIS